MNIIEKHGKFHCLHNGFIYGSFKSVGEATVFVEDFNKGQVVGADESVLPLASTLDEPKVDAPVEDAESASEGASE